MTAKLLDSFGGKFAEQWAAALLTPAFVFWLGGFVTIIQHFGWQPLVDRFTQYPELLQITILIGCLCVMAASAFVVQRFESITLRFLAGYWHPWLQSFRQQRINYYSERKKRTDKRVQNLFKGIERNIERTKILDRWIERRTKILGERIKQIKAKLNTFKTRNSPDDPVSSDPGEYSKLNKQVALDKKSLGGYRKNST